MGTLELVSDYFNREAERFDAIYERDKPLHQQIGDRIFRNVIHERYSLVMNAVGAVGSKILDVGCGPGRYGIEFARRGAKRCLGIDTATSMLDIAKKEAAKAGVADRCEWVHSDWMSWKGSESFDAVTAIGYYDYLDDPLTHLQKMIAHVPNGRVLASFPKRWEVRTPLRVLRFKLAKGFVRFYDRGDVLDLFKAAGGPHALACLSLVDLGRDFIAIYDVGAAAKRA